MDFVLTFVLLFCGKTVDMVFGKEVSSNLTNTFICAEMCSQRECPDDHFHCSYGACIPITFTCDSKQDCYDWSDEDEVLCGTGLPQGSCRLPSPKPGTRYATSGCPGCRPGQVVPQLTRLDYTCDVDGWLKGSRTVYCQNNQWLPSIPICLNNTNALDITCSPILEANGATKRCESKWGPSKGWISCEEPLPVGTNVFLDCPALYERRAGSTHIVCLPDGTWSQIPLSCSPVCGIRESSVTLIVNGWEVSNKENTPWQATLFSHEKGQWKFFCGGTLIGERVVLTAGHCVWKTFPETIRVAFGIISNNLDTVEEGAQVLDVEKIEIQKSYQDHEGNYASDIAILILKMPVEITTAVRPACVNFRSDSTLLQAQQDGDSGFVSGMGITENDTYSSTLRTTSMKMISDEKCRESQHRDFRKYITYTSFCAGWANGTGVCNGDSGSGLMLRRPNTTIWEVHGIVSISPRRLGTAICDPRTYTIFTKVSLYGDWIRSIIETIPITGPPDAHRHPNNDDIII